LVTSLSTPFVSDSSSVSSIIFDSAL
jgi:hypothetical protein